MSACSGLEDKELSDLFIPKTALATTSTSNVGTITRAKITATVMVCDSRIG